MFTKASEFVDYVMSFYGDCPDAIYDYCFTKDEVIDALAIRLTDDKYDYLDFDGDSIDREVVRDIVLDKLRSK